MRRALTFFFEAMAHRLAQGKLFHIKGIGLFGPSIKSSKWGTDSAQPRFVPSRSLLKMFLSPGVLHVDHEESNRLLFEQRAQRRKTKARKRFRVPLPPALKEKSERMQQFSLRSSKMTLPQVFQRARSVMNREKAAHERK